MKLPYSEVKKIQRMNQKELTQYVTAIYGAGVTDTENELENATVDRWLEIVNSSSHVTEYFSIWDYNDLYERLSKEFTAKNVNRIMAIITKGEYKK